MQVDSLTGNGSVRLDLNSSGTGIVDAAGNTIAGGLTGASYNIDRVAPGVVSVDVPANGTYVAGQNLDFTVNFSEAVQVDTTGGTPRIEVTLDTGGTAYATYLSGAGTDTLVFRLTVASGQLDTTGISVGNSFQLNGGAVRDSVGNNVATALNGLGDTSGVRVDAAVPGVDSVGLPADGSYKAGDVLSFTVNTSEAVVVDTATGTPRLVLSVGGVTHYASYVSGAASGALVFQYTVQAGDTAASGLVVGTTLDLNGGSVRDAAGNDLTLNLNGLGSAAGVLIDTSAPTASSLVRVDGSPGSSGSISYTLTFSENVSSVDASDLSLFFTGTASASIASVTRIDGRTYTVVVNGIAGSGSLRLDLNGSGTGIMDTAGNAIVGGLTGASYSIDQVAPGVVDVDVPADGSYKAGDVLSFTVNTGEGVVVDTATGTPRLVLSAGGVTHYASYVSGAASGALVFQYTVQAGDTAASGRRGHPLCQLCFRRRQWRTGVPVHRAGRRHRRQRPGGRHYPGPQWRQRA
ncbi:hypothetical protein ASF84_09075 [Pseudomonas sp. Leaf127]|nr:hypothetical protein ASF84_09075 [Pseudomonas sp. Leaf127]